MAMNDLLASTFELGLAGTAGALLGLLFFGGLWWTLRRAFDSPRPALWVGGSLLLRMACVAAGFILVAAGDWRRLLSCLLGFWAARWLVVRLTAVPVAQPSDASCVTAKHGRSDAATGPT
jgi:F1F0 ATPase subunit 2